MNWAQSTRVRRSVTRTVRFPASGSTAMNTLAVPRRSYSLSYLATWPGLAGSGSRTFRDQLFAAFIHAHHRLLRVVGAVIHVQHVFHGRDKISRRSFRQAPAFFQPRLKFVFLSVRRTVSWDNDSTYPRPTMRSPNNRKVQRDRPAGGAPHVKAIKCASVLPSIFFS